jgi:hypothetical protein
MKLELPLDELKQYLKSSYNLEIDPNLLLLIALS